MNIKRDLQSMLDAQNQTILQQLKLDNRKKVAKLNKRLDNLEVALNVQFVQLRAQVAKLPTTVQSSLKPLKNPANDKDGSDSGTDDSDSEGIKKNKNADSFHRRKVYDIMCMVFDKDVVKKGEDFEKDECFAKIIRKLDLDEDEYANGYDIHNRNLSLIRNLTQRFQAQYDYYQNDKSALTADSKNIGLELKKLREEIEKICRILKYPVNFEEIANEAILERCIFNEPYEKYYSYIPVVCAMMKCNDLLDKLSPCSNSGASFMQYWYHEK